MPTEVTPVKLLDDIPSNAASDSDIHDTSARSSNVLNASDCSNIPNTEQVITLRDIMKAINICNSSVNSLLHNLEGIRGDISLLRQDIHTIKERIMGAEERISALEDSLQIFMKTLKKYYPCMALV